jgi:hypothetical protein
VTACYARRVSAVFFPFQDPVEADVGGGLYSPACYIPSDEDIRRVLAALVHE